MTPPTPGPPEPPSRHLWGSTGTGPQSNEAQGDPTTLPGHVVNVVWSLNDRQQLVLFRELLRHLSRGLSREEILEVMEDALFLSRDGASSGS